MKNNRIEINKLSKTYEIGHGRTGTLFETLSNLINFQRAKKEKIWAIRDISFDVAKGEVLGIIGRNGAGKSTLLKILSRITPPSSGSIKLNGRVSSLLEVGTGFHHELTGRQNIFLNGTILGMRKHEIKSLFDEIVDFSGVEKYIDTPVKHYSSGMYMRLAFAVAAHLNSEIILIDEVLSVGDYEFQKKCLRKMEGLSRVEERSIIFVSHNIDAVSRLCDKVLVLDAGRLQSICETSEGIEYYLSILNKSVGTSQLSNSRSIITIFFNSDKSAHSSRFKIGEDIKISVLINPINTIVYPIMSIRVTSSGGLDMFTVRSDSFIKSPFKGPIVSLVKMNILLKDPPLLDGLYFLSLGFNDGNKKLVYHNSTVYFTVIPNRPNDSYRVISKNSQLKGVLFCKSNWSIDAT